MVGQNKKNSEFSEVYNSSMQAILECFAVCNSCSKKCIEEGHKKTAAICLDCADICSLAVKTVSKHSTLENEVLDLCETACQKCAEECKKMDVKHCQECAKVCENCAEACSSGVSAKG